MQEKTRMWSSGRVGEWSSGGVINGQWSSDRVVEWKKVIVHRMKKLSCSASGGFILSKKIAELLRKRSDQRR